MQKIMDENDTTIIDNVYGGFDDTKSGRLYYYQRNFFHPIFIDNNKVQATINKAIRKFMKENKQLILKDRKDPNYKTLLELFDEQMKGKK